jgi:hypothetical protein
LAIYSIPTRGFTAAVSVFGGTPPAKPLTCKSKFVPRFPAMRLTARGHTAPVRLLCPAPPNSIYRQKTSPGCRAIPIHRLLVFRSLSLTLSVFQRKQKTLLTRGKQGEEILFRFVTCLHRAHPNYLRAVARLAPGIVQGQTHGPGCTGYDVSR